MTEPFRLTAAFVSACGQIMRRRGFLRAAWLAVPGIFLGDLFARQAQADRPGAQARSVLVVYAGGGISHHDAFDPKPEAPSEVRREFSTIQTALPGSSDRLGATPHERPITPQDIAATLFEFLGLDPFQEYASIDGRVFRMLDRGEAIRELL
ncbi:MAG: hypothetical protein ACM3U2_21595 [Deltaproteobacteria bacterium]